MSEVQALATNVAGWLIQAVLLGTALALLTWGISRWLLPKAPPALHAGLWLIVLAKFLLPLGPGFSYSLASLVGLPELGTNQAVAPVGGTTYLILETEAAGTGAAADAATQTATVQPLGASELAGGTTWLSFWLVWVMAAYLVGVVAMVSWRVRAYMQFARRANQLPLAGRGVRRLVKRLCRRSDVQRVPRVRLSDGTHAPYVYGLLRPTLVLPRHAAMHGPELEAVLLHEIAHLRRFDLVTRLAQWVAGNLLFFWPVVAWVNRRIDLAREHACDEWALSHGRLAPGQYARCLLRALQAAPPAQAGYQPAAMATTARQVERRIAMIMDHSQKSTPSYWRLVASGSLCAWAAFALTGTSVATEELPQQTDSPKAVWVSEDGRTMEVDTTPAPRWMVEGGNQFMMIQSSSDSGPQQFAFSRRIDSNSLAAFQDKYPMADADQDGNISMQEHDAFLVAVAMQDPQKVLAQFPHADGNADGQLSASEAAGLVSGMPHVESFVREAGNMTPVVTGVWTAQPPQDTVVVEGVELDGNVFVEERVVEDGARRIVTRVATQGNPDEIAEVSVNVEADDSGQQIIRIDRGTGDVQEIVLNLDEVAGEAGENGFVEKRVIAIQDPGTGEIEVIESDDAETVVIGHPMAEVHDMLIEGAAGHIALLHEHFGGEPENVDVEVIAEGDGEETFIVRAHGEHMAHLQAGSWLLENIDGVPTREDVAGYVQAVTDLPLSKFLELNPEADHNKDGVLTERERDAFIKRNTSRQRMKLIEKYPDADLNEDGMLTNEELREYFHGKRSGERRGGERIRIEMQPDAASEEVIIEEL